jgi:predicted dehydrogenase
MKAVILGYGSIGQRHTRILQEMGMEVGIVSKHAVPAPQIVSELSVALDRFQPTYVVIANETAGHLSALRELETAGYCGKVLVEKPLFHKTHDLHKRNTFNKLKVFVGYNLRFHPLLIRLQGLLKNRKIYSVNVYVGQHLSTWRVGREHKFSYSSHKDKGGGVLRDLSHEIDYVIWLFGRCQTLTSNVGTFGDLRIDSEDTAAVLMRTYSCASVSVEMNYLDRIGQRTLTVNAEGGTYRLDWMAGTLTGTDVSENVSIDRDFTYKALHRTIIESSFDDVKLCGLEQGLEVLRTIEAVEASNKERTWINL